MEEKRKGGRKEWEGGREGGRSKQRGSFLKNVPDQSRLIRSHS